MRRIHIPPEKGARYVIYVRRLTVTIVTSWNRNRGGDVTVRGVIAGRLLKTTHR